MPRAIPKRCRQSGCGNSTTHRHGYCDQHADNKGFGKYRKDLKKKGKLVYQTNEWKHHIAPKVKSLANFLCLNCLLGNPSIVKQGVIAEHIVPASKGGDESLSNLSCFCKECANEKTGWEVGKTKQQILKRYGHTSVLKYREGA
ncbi:HNH endonuclease [Pseudoalteromonas piratica]|jgi:5-methylcytosine-specific restriction protein A|uniref:HNH endonuclease 5 domain-containing protein n=1 Tax=Pseudoalteromonas piratica TaxID=1348114 RepID=A0A0A7EGU5_9GAMM|nr:hypothetical protein OM33_08465 [Pseudoalteromonas piratica]